MILSARLSTLGLALALGPPAQSSPAQGQGEPPEEVAEAGEAELPRGPAYATVLAVAPEDQRDEAAAHELTASGKAAFRDDRFEEAIDFFAESYRLYPNVTLLYALGSAHRRAYESGSGDVIHRRLSIRRYQQYLSEAPDADFASFAQNYLTALLAERDLGDLDLESVTRILVSTSIEDATMVIDGGGELSAPGVVSVEPGEHEIVVRAPGYRKLEQRFDVPEGATYQVQAELEGLPGRVAVEGPKGALVRVDGRIIGKLPLATPIVVEAGEHTVTVTKNGHRPFNDDVELERDGHASVRATLDDSNQRLTSYFFMSFGGVGIVASAVLTGFAVDRQSRARILDERRAMDYLTTAEFERYGELVAERDQFRAGAVLAGISGIALMVTGVALFAYDIPRLDDTGRVARLRATPVVGVGQVGGTVALQF